jgi:hypothetical protein
MGGGLFGTHLYLNPKCLIFSVAVISVYFLPHPPSLAHTIVMVFLLGMSSYIALAWYDVIFDCNDRLKPTFLGYLSKPFKPQEYSEQYNQLPVKDKKIIGYVDVAVLSIIIITFIYPFYTTKSLMK